MIRHFSRYAALTCFLTLSILSACSKKEKTTGPSTEAPVSTKEELPDWNKSKTAVLYFFTTLKDQPLGTTAEIYHNISEQLKDTSSYRVVLLDRSDINTSTAINGCSILAAATNMVPMYNLNKYKGNIAEGTGILVKETIQQQDSYEIAADCRLKRFNTFAVKGVEWPLATVRFETQSQINAATNILSSSISQNTVIIGSTTVDIFDKIKEKVTTLSKTYRVQKVTENTNGYVVFYISPKYWVLREAVQSTVYGEVQMIKLSIEANVFY